jgi:DNA replication protein DnaC
VGQKTGEQGYRVRYQSGVALHLTTSLADIPLPARLRRYARPDLLIIDEFVAAPSVRRRRIRFLISSTHETKKAPTALLAKVAFDKWGDFALRRFPCDAFP